MFNKNYSQLNQHTVITIYFPDLLNVFITNRSSLITISYTYYVLKRFMI